MTLTVEPEYERGKQETLRAVFKIINRLSHRYRHQRFIATHGDAYRLALDAITQSITSRLQAPPAPETPDPWPDNDADRGDRILELEAELASLQPVTGMPEQAHPMRERVKGYDTSARDLARRALESFEPESDEAVLRTIADYPEDGTPEQRGELSELEDDAYSPGGPTPTDRETISELVEQWERAQTSLSAQPAWAGLRDLVERTIAAITRLIDEREQWQETAEEGVSLHLDTAMRLQSQLAAAKEENERLTSALNDSTEWLEQLITVCPEPNGELHIAATIKRNRAALKQGASGESKPSAEQTEPRSEANPDDLATVS